MDITAILNLIQMKAQSRTTCTKTAVGALLGILEDDGNFYPMFWGFNRNEDYNCRVKGCYRKLMFGVDTIETRPWCKAVHAEEDAILKMVQSGKKVNTAFVTRYPCEKCTRLLVHHGIKHVIYGRPFEISEQSKKMFEEHGVLVEHISDWNGDPNDFNK